MSTWNPFTSHGRHRAQMGLPPAAGDLGPEAPPAVTMPPAVQTATPPAPPAGTAARVPDAERPDATITLPAVQDGSRPGPDPAPPRVTVTRTALPDGPPGPASLPQLPSRVPGPARDLPAWTPPENLGRVRDALKALAAAGAPDPAPLPATLLLAVGDGGHGTAKELLSGWPAYAGTRATGTGQRVAGLLIGTADDGALIYLENPSAEWWDEHIAQAILARDAQARENSAGPAAAPAEAEEVA